MAVTPPGARTEKWDRRFNTTRIKEILDEERPTMLVNAGTKFAEITAMEDATKTIVNTAGISAKDTANYLNFAREVWKADGTYEGETLAIEVEVFLNKWVARGLTQSVLESIRTNVFTIPAPAGP